MHNFLKNTPIFHATKKVFVAVMGSLFFFFSYFPELDHTETTLVWRRLWNHWESRSPVLQQSHSLQGQTKLFVKNQCIATKKACSTQQHTTSPAHNLSCPQSSLPGSWSQPKHVGCTPPSAPGGKCTSGGGGGGVLLNFAPSSCSGKALCPGDLQH